jgi:predicted RNA-binding protein
MMCQAHVLVVQGDKEEEVMRDVILVEQLPQGVRLHTFFEEPRTIAGGEILTIDLLKHTVRLKVEEER